MSLLKIKPFSVDQIETFSFANANVVGNINTGNANLGNLATANYFSGNASLLFGITAGNITGQVANALVAGTVYTASQPNITSVGTLTSLTVSGASDLGAVANVKITGGSSGYVLKTDGAGNLTWGTVTSGTGNANVAGANTQIQFNDGTNLSASANLTFDVSTKTLTVDKITANGAGLSGIVGSNVVGEVAYAAVANSVAGANVSGEVAYAAVANSVAGANVSGYVANATHANVADSANSVAGANVSGEVAYAAVANSVAGANVSGAVAYATTANSVAGANVSGEVAYAAVANSVAGANVSGYVANANHANVADSANSVAGANVSGEVSFAAVANSVAGANVSGYVANATHANVADSANSVAGANVSGQVGNALVAGTVYTAAQPNITSVGTLTSLDVSGSITSGNITITGNLIVSGTTTSVNSTVTQIADPIFELGGGANGAALTNDDGFDRGQLLHYFQGGVIDAFIGWDSSNSEFGLGSNVTVANNTVTFNEYGALRTGNINATNANLGNLVTANYFSGNGSSLTGVIATTATTVTSSSQPNITSVGTLTSLSVTGNITAGNVDGGNLVSASYISGNGSLLTSITGANVTGIVGNATHANVADSANSVAGANVTGQVANALVAGTVYTNAQPNITSVGTLTSLSVSGTTNLGAVGNITITGGSANYFLKTDGAGALSWSALPSTTLSVDTYTGDGSWTMKTLSSTPLNINYTIVAIGGVFQPREAYDVTGAVITFDDAPPNGAIVEVTTINGGTAGASGYVYQGVNSSSTAVAGVRYLIDSSSVAVTITLPSTANLGDEIGIIDATGSASTHNITVARNGSKIQGAASDMTVDTDRAAFTLVYYNSTQGWVLTNV